MTTPSPARSLDADLAAFWRALAARDAAPVVGPDMDKRFANRKRARRVRRGR